MADWGNRLSEARRASRLTQAQLAALAGVSAELVSLYERATPSPERGTVIRLARALRLDRATTNQILADTKLAPLPAGRLVQFETRRRTLDYLQREVDGYAWPCLVTNNRMEIICWNEPARRVAEMDFAQTLPLQYQRNLFRIAAMQHFRDRAENWDEIVSVMIALLKSEGASLSDPDDGPPYFPTLVQDLAREHPDVFPHILGLWLTAPARSEGHRVTFDVHWRLEDGTPLLFNCVLGSWTDFDAAWALDWHPADAATWDWLHEHVRPAEDGAADVASASTGMVDGDVAPLRAQPANAWHELLRQGREGSRLTRTELANLTGVSDQSLYSYEAGRRRPAREIVLQLAWAMQLDSATTNLILDELGHEPEPSDWACLLSGQPRRTRQWSTANAAAEARRSRAAMGEFIGAHPWPCLVLNEQCEVMSANDPMSRVTGTSLARNGLGGATRNLTGWLFSPECRAHAINWDELVSALLPGALKLAALRRPSGISNGAAGAALDHLRRDDPTTLNRLQRLWQTAPLAALGERMTVPLVWRHDGMALAFTCVVSLWSAYDNLWSLDWHPADATTWRWLRNEIEEI